MVDPSSHAPTRVVKSLRAMIDRAGYAIQHGALAASLGLVNFAFWRALEPGIRRPTAREIEALDRRFRALLRADLANVERGIYPRELLFQVPIRAYLRAAPEAILDAPRMIRRRRRGRFDDLPAGEDHGRYPAYYRRNFHWQTDGWLSDRSARLYDLGVETLFGGTADVMRRMALPPILEIIRGREGARVLDAACGTGRFLHQLRRAAPRARLYGVDLSRHYVAAARELLAGGAVPATLAVEDVEALPFRDETFDVVSSVFVFHELPANVRRNAAREARRVLRPGGRFVICDAAQLSDGDEIAPILEEFHRLYHEPYFKGYLRDDLGRLLVDTGFEEIAEGPGFVSKVVVGTKSLD